MKYIRLIVTVIVAAVVLLFVVQGADTDQPVAESKINGVSFVAPPRVVGKQALMPIKKMNANWIAITPYAFSRPAEPHLVQQWQPVKQELGQYARQACKPMLFTEFGYQSVDFTADGHWKRERSSTPVNVQAQANAYQGLFQALWDEPWFAGGFLWKWHARHHQSGGPDNKRFTPQN